MFASNMWTGFDFDYIYKYIRGRLVSLLVLEEILQVGLA